MASDLDYLRSLTVEPLDPKKHDRAAFSSGVARIDNFLKLTAKKHQADDHTRVRVALEPTGAVVGYYTLSAHSLDFPETADLPKSLTRNAPRHGVIPAAYLSMVGVAASSQGRDLGRFLSADAFQSVLAAANHVAIAALVLDVLDDDGEEVADRRQRFYKRLGFQGFPSQPRRMFISLETMRKML